MTATPLFPDGAGQTLVVGGGLAGLAAATYLARGGARVTVLEKSAAVGGRAITDTPGGYALNRGPHALYTGGPASSVLKELGVRYTYGVPKNVFVRDARGLHPFPATPRDFFRTRLVDAADKAELMRVFMRIGMLRPAAYAHVSVAEWIDQHARRPRIRQLLASVARVNLYADALDIASADTFLGRIQQTLRHPIHYVDGGWQTFVNGLRDAALSAGVHIVPSASVAEVYVESGRATGVRLHDDSVLHGGSVLLAVPPEDALRMLPPSSAPSLQRALEAILPVHVACLDLALERLPDPAHPVGFDLERPRFVTAQSEVARLAPAGGAVVHAFAQADPRVPADPEHQRAELEAFLDEVQPGWQALAVERRFLPRMLGSGALPLATYGGLAGRMACRSEDIAGVYFAGDWVGPRGYLVDATLDSAREAAHEILHSQSVQFTSSVARVAA